MTLSVCMIVRNEAAVLERCLEGVCLFADEIIIVDTGSDDATKDIAARYTNKVYDYKWRDDFGSARNESYRYAACDYIMWADADDVIDEENAAKINALKKNLTAETESVNMIYDALETGGLIAQSRMVRRKTNPVWKGRLHEFIPLNHPAMQTDIRIYHRKTGPRDYARNIRIIRIMSDEDFLESPRRAADCWLDCFMSDEISLADKLFRLCQGQAEDGIDGEIWILFGDILMKLKEYEAAIEWYKLAVFSREDNTVFSAYQRIVKCYFKLEKWEEARQYNEMALAARPDSRSALLNRIKLAKTR